MSTGSHVPERVVTEEGVAVAVGERLGEGAEGTVYRAEDRGVVKIYNAAHRTEHRARKIAAMIANRPADPLADRDPAVRTTADESGGRGTEPDGTAEPASYVWPTARVFAAGDSEAFLGYLMPRLDLTRRR